MQGSSPIPLYLWFFIAPYLCILVMQLSAMIYIYHHAEKISFALF